MAQMRQQAPHTHIAHQREGTSFNVNEAHNRHSGLGNRSMRLRNACAVRQGNENRHRVGLWNHFEGFDRFPARQALINCQGLF
jgi:hypothetical protein